MDPQTLILSVITLLLLAGAIYGISSGAKKKNLTIGQFINTLFLREESTFVVALIFCLSIGEGMVAGSIVPPTEAGGNPLARMFLHIVFSVTGGIFGVLAMKKLVEAITMIFGTKRYHWVFTIVAFLLSVSLVGASLLLPYINVDIMSSGLGENQLFHIALAQWMPWYDHIDWHVPEDFNPIDKMSMYMKASYWALIVHYCISFIDGLYAVYEHYKFGVDKIVDAKTKKAFDDMSKEAGVTDDVKKDNKDEKKPDDKKPSNDVGYLKAVKEVIDFLGLTNKDSANKMVVDAMQSKTGEDVAHMSAILTQFTDSIKNLDKKKPSLSPSIYQAQVKELQKKITEKFSAALSDGGFEIALPK